MVGFLKQNTTVTVKVGPFVDSADGATAETGLTITQADVRLSKNGGNIAQKNDSNSLSHDELGIYNCQFDSTDTGTLGRLALFVDEAGALAVRHDYMIVPANVYQTLFSNDKFDVNVAEVSDDSTAADNLELACDNYSATRGLAGTALPAAAADAAGGIPISDAGGLDLDGMNSNVDSILTDTGTTLDNKLDVIDSNVDSILVDTGTTLDNKIDAIDSNVDAILVDTGTTLNDKIDVIDSNVDSILVDTGTTLDGKIDTIDGNVDSILTDTGTTLDGKIDTIDGIVDAILADTGTDGVVLAANSVSPTAIANDAITADKIDSNAITATTIADNAITAAKIDSNAISATTLDSNTIDANALAAGAVDEILDEVVEGSTTFRQAIRLFLSVLTGKSSGGGTATLTFRDIGDSKDRLSVTVDADGNRTAVGTRDGA